MVAICMATYEPSASALRRQLESIRAQTMRKWHCWIVDDASGPAARRLLRDQIDEDPRFTVVFEEQNVGFYRNFERALGRAQGHAPWLALADQDDEWWPEKLDVLLADALATEAGLVCSDVEIRAESGQLISPTYWVGRRHNEDDLSALFFANTVTGAASLISDHVVTTALPFPRAFPSSFHDHWLALVARCTAGVRYIDRPLMTYVQHSSNAIGHRAGQVDPVATVLLRTLTRRWWRRPDNRYFDDEVARLSDMAATLLERVNEPHPKDAGVLRAVASLHGPRPALGWLGREAVRELREPTVTMWRRRRVMASVLWTVLSRYRRRERR